MAVQKSKQQKYKIKYRRFQQQNKFLKDTDIKLKICTLCASKYYNSCITCYNRIKEYLKNI